MFPENVDVPFVPVVLHVLHCTDEQTPRPHLLGFELVEGSFSTLEAAFEQPLDDGLPLRRQLLQGNRRGRGS